MIGPVVVEEVVLVVLVVLVLLLSCWTAELSSCCCTCPLPNSAGLTQSHDVDVDDDVRDGGFVVASRFPLSASQATPATHPPVLSSALPKMSE